MTPFTLGSIAAKAGVRSRQEIIRIDGIPTASWMSVTLRILSHTGNKDQLIVETRPLNKRQPVEKHVLNLTDWQLDDLKPIHLPVWALHPISPKPSLPSCCVIISMVLSGHFSMRWNTVDFTKLNLMMIAKLFTGKFHSKASAVPFSFFFCRKCIQSGSHCFHEFFGLPGALLLASSIFCLFQALMVDMPVSTDWKTLRTAYSTQSPFSRLFSWFCADHICFNSGHYKRSVEIISTSAYCGFDLKPESVYVSFKQAGSNNSRGAQIAGLRYFCREIDPSPDLDHASVGSSAWNHTLNHQILLFSR